MAISFDAVSTNGASAVNLSWSHTVTGSQLLLLVWVYYWNDTRTISGVTYNSVALTKLDTQVGGPRTMELWYLLDPATGTNTVAVTGTGAAADKQGIGLSFTGTRPSAVPTAFKASGNSTAPSVTATAATNDMVADGVGLDVIGGTLTVGADQTQRANFTQGDQEAASSTEPGAASVVMSWTSDSGNWAIIAAVIKPSAIITLQSTAGVASLINLEVATPANLALQSTDGVASLTNLEVATPGNLTLQAVAGIASLANVDLTANFLNSSGSLTALRSGPRDPVIRLRDPQPLVARDPTWRAR